MDFILWDEITLKIAAVLPSLIAGGGKGAKKNSLINYAGVLLFNNLKYRQYINVRIHHYTNRLRRGWNAYACFLLGDVDLI